MAKNIEQLTVSAFVQKQREYRQLIDVEKVRNAEEVAFARAQGDLSENADYDAARKEEAQIAASIKAIEELKNNCVVILTKEDLDSLTAEYKELSLTETIESSTRLEELQFILDHYKVVKLDTISIGCVITYRDLRNGAEKTVTMVSTAVLRPLTGQISNLSPLGVALYGKHVGDVVVVSAPKGDYQVEVLNFALDTSENN